jgi:hypothetical protein
MVEINSSFQSSWTLAESLIYEIATHLRTGRNFWLCGNLDRYYWELEAVVRVLKGMLDDKEKEKADNLEEEIAKHLRAIKTQENRIKLSSSLKKYDEMVMTFLHKHKLDVPAKKDYTNLGG